MSTIAHQQVTLKQPKGLYLLFSTELWERFGYYTVQAILILYLTKKLGYTDQVANLLYATYAALLYLTPILGGYLADRFLGFQRAIVVGGILSMLGYILCAFPQKTPFFIGLSILIVANGLFKPNISSIVGDLYQPNDPRREGGFTLFYMGINIGALVPPLIAGGTVEHFGWHSGFLLAALGMAIAVVIFIVGKKGLDFAGTIPANSPLQKNRFAKLRFEALFYLGFAVLAAGCFLALQFPETTNLLVQIGAVIVAATVLFFMIQEAPSDRKKMLASLILTAISVGFWALYNQTFTSLTLFADRNMEQHFLGIPVNASAMQFFNPLFIILLSPVLSMLWVKLAKRNLNPSIPGKFFLGVVFMTLGFLILPAGIGMFASEGVISSSWLVVSYLMQTVGELLISPVGLAMITVLTPKRLVGMMMGVWFFAQAASFAIGGSLANLAAMPDNVDKITSLGIYDHAFLIFGLISLGLAVASALLIPFLRSLIREHE